MTSPSGIRQFAFLDGPINLQLFDTYPEALKQISGMDPEEDQEVGLVIASFHSLTNESFLDFVNGISNSWPRIVSVSIDMGSFVNRGDGGPPPPTPETVAQVLLMNLPNLRKLHFSGSSTAPSNPNPNGVGYDLRAKTTLLAAVVAPLEELVVGHLVENPSQDIIDFSNLLSSKDNLNNALTSFQITDHWTYAWNLPQREQIYEKLNPLFATLGSSSELPNIKNLHFRINGTPPPRNSQQRQSISQLCKNKLVDLFVNDPLFGSNELIFPSLCESSTLKILKIWEFDLQGSGADLVAELVRTSQSLELLSLVHDDRWHHLRHRRAGIEEAKENFLNKLIDDGLAKANDKSRLVCVNFSWHIPISTWKKFLQLIKDGTNKTTNKTIVEFSGKDVYEPPYTSSSLSRLETQDNTLFQEIDFYTMLNRFNCRDITAISSPNMQQDYYNKAKAIVSKEEMKTVESWNIRGSRPLKYNSREPRMKDDEAAWLSCLFYLLRSNAAIVNYLVPQKEEEEAMEMQQPSSSSSSSPNTHTSTITTTTTTTTTTVTGKRKLEE